MPGPTPTTGRAATLAFTAVEKLAGGSAADLFRFAGGVGDRDALPAGPGRTRWPGEPGAGFIPSPEPDAGTVGTILPAGFSGVENLVGGAGPDQFLFRGGSLAGTVTGGAGADLLMGDSVGRTFTLSGTDAGTVGGLAAFVQIENLRGGLGADTWSPCRVG